MSDEHVVEMAKRQLEQARHETIVDFDHCNSRQIERNIEWIREQVGKGEFTLEQIGTSNEELEKINERAFNLRERN